MKKFFTLAVVALMGLTANAQLISSNMVSSGEKTGYSRLGISYNSLSMGGSGDALSGVSLDWTKGISISSSMPLFIETGIGATYGWLSDSEKINGYTIESNENYLAVKVPVNIVYKFDVADSGLKIAPFLGLYAKGNLLGEQTVEGGGLSYTYNYYDDYDATRFNIGIDFGANVEYNKFFLGISYAKDLNKFAGGTMGIFSATIGFVF